MKHLHSLYTNVQHFAVRLNVCLFKDTLSLFSIFFITAPTSSSLLSCCSLPRGWRPTLPLTSWPLTLGKTLEIETLTHGRLHCRCFGASVWCWWKDGYPPTAWQTTSATCEEGDWRAGLWLCWGSWLLLRLRRVLKSALKSWWFYYVFSFIKWLEMSLSTWTSWTWCFSCSEPLGGGSSLQDRV